MVCMGPIAVVGNQDARQTDPLSMRLERRPEVCLIYSQYPITQKCFRVAMAAYLGPRT